MASIYEIPVKKITGEDATLGEYKGKVLVVVNVASKCGLTAQYEALEKLYETYGPKGVVVVGFPANDFKQQEPGTDAEIQNFCTANFVVKFPLYSKITVVGADKNELYKTLIAAQPKATSVNEPSWREKLKGYGIEPNPEPEILWNFEKFIIAKNGEVAARFAPDTTPDAPEFVKAIEAELAK
jgi:glutathione peroxidase